jgi:hypothetical protein
MKPSASDYPRYVLIATLHAQGRSIRSIARRVGLSRSWVHEIVSGLRCDDDDECTPPFTFVGMDPERGGKGSVERFVDGRHAVRHRGDLAGRPRRAGVAAGVHDLHRQVLADGYVRVDRGDVYWQWERRPSADRAASGAAVGPQHS